MEDLPVLKCLAIVISSSNAHPNEPNLEPAKHKAVSRWETTGSSSLQLRSSASVSSEPSP